MPAPLLAVFSTFLQGILAVSNSGAPTGRRQTVNDALGNRTTYGAGRFGIYEGTTRHAGGEVTPPAIAAVFQGCEGQRGTRENRNLCRQSYKVYPRLERTARTVQQLQGRATLLGLELRDEELTQKLSTATGEPPDYTPIAVVVLVLLGAWVVWR